MSQQEPHGNPFLGHWEKFLITRSTEPAVFDAQGVVARTFQGVEDEAVRWMKRIRGHRRVILGLGNDPSWPGCLLGIWRAGAAVIPCEASLPREALEELVSLTGASLWIGKEGQRTLGTPHDPPSFPECSLLKTTSGTTSQRRVVAFTGGQFLQDVENLMRVMRITPRDRNFGLISFAHSYGLSNLIGMLLGGGVPLIVATDAMPRAVIASLEASQATVFPGVPAMFRGLAALGAPLPTVRLCISAGALLPRRDATAFHRATGLKIHGFYGATECGGICYDATDDAEVPEGFVGPAIPGVAIEATSPGSPCGIRVRGPAVGLGYSPSREDDALGHGVFVPPDLVEVHTMGCRIAGRESDFINISGRKVNPVEIERALTRHPAVREAVIFGTRAPDGRGEAIAACVVSDLPVPRLRAFAAESLPAWQVPRLWFPTDSIPANERGKISRRDLARQFAG